MNQTTWIILLAVSTLFVLIAVILLVFFITVKIRTTKSAKDIQNFGKVSEKQIDELLKDSFGEDAVFSGIYLPYVKLDYEKLAEIDHIVVLRSGVFVIEVKSHNGYINCPDEHDWWQTYNDKKLKFYNPIRQNATHVRVVQDILKSRGQYNVQVYNVVVFTSHKVTFSKEYENVIPTSALVNYIKKTGKRNAMSNGQTKRIRSLIGDNVKTGKKAENKHKKAFKNYQNNK